MRACTAFLAIAGAVGGWIAAHAGETGVTMMKGICRKLTTPTDDLSKACRSIVVTTTYTREGRVGFYFASDARAVTFSGGAREIRVTDNTGVQMIDKVTIDAGGGARSIVAVGSCRYTNALTPRPMVNCKAETEEGNFLASFDVVKGTAPGPEGQ